MARSKSDRERKYTVATEDYLEAIRVVMDNNNSAEARVKDIADEMGVKYPSVNNALQSLSKEKLINYRPYKNITLTTKGESLARRVLYKHKLLTCLLIEALDCDEKLAEENACRIEHDLDDVVIKKLAKLRKQNR